MLEDGSRAEPIVDDRRKEAQEQHALKLLRIGWKGAAVARKVGVDRTTVYRWAKKHDIELPRNESEFGKVDKAEALRMGDAEYNGEKLFSRAEIAEMFGCSESYIKHLRRQRNQGLL